MGTLFPTLVYVLCFATSAACAFLLARTFRKSGSRMLFWSALCFAFLALVNLAELAGNAAVAYSLPGDARFIVAGLSIEYVKKARGRISAEAEVDVPPGSERREIAVPVTLRDASGEVVARATLRTLIGPKK